MAEEFQVGGLMLLAPHLSIPKLASIDFPFFPLKQHSGAASSAVITLNFQKHTNRGHLTSACAHNLYNQKCGCSPGQPADKVRRPLRF